MTDRQKVALMRSAKTGADYKYGMGGLPKTHKAPKPISLPKLKCLEDEPAASGKREPKEG